MRNTRPLAGMAAILCAAGLALTGTAGANATEVRAVDMPDHIVNGDFEAYPLDPSVMPNVMDWASYDPDAGEYYSNRFSWETIPGFDASRFGWTSDQEDGSIGNPGEQRAHAVELQRDWNGNTYAEITAAQPNTAIYQTIRTIPGAVYTIRLDHASLTDMHVDEMKVVVGGETVPMTRTSVNGHGDKLGETSEIVRTTVSNGPDVSGAYSSRNHEGQWETYEGTYVADSTETVFTFESVSSLDNRTGNLVDNISFEISYPLTYDLNGGNGIIPNKEAGR